MTFTHCLDCGAAFESRNKSRCPRCTERHNAAIKAALNEQRGKGGKRESVYSPNAGRRIVASVGKCEGCGISGKRLVNGYCDVCRSCGANERECTR